MILTQLINNKLLLLDAKRNLFEAEPEYREREKLLKEQLLTSYASEKIIRTVTVSDAETEAYYNDHTSELIGEETVSASHILVDTEDLALEILSKIEAGELSFADAARKYSSCPSKENGGSLGQFGRGQMVPEFDKRVFEMEVGEITKEPVKTQFGYHLIQLDSKTEAREIPYAEIKDRLKDAVLQEKQKKAYDSKINQLKILYPVDISL
ncbi:MAG: peptidylprolyl isomerase [Clostridia bacterium]|nr:peptidylprolyl isomerase [Clostridia bacterium]